MSAAPALCLRTPGLLACGVEVVGGHAGALSAPELSASAALALCLRTPGFLAWGVAVDGGHAGCLSAPGPSVSG
ncbi:hypothetical protein AB0885_14845, partial [Streptomyces sp. NPDC005534]